MRLDESLLTGIAAFRSLAWIWAAIAVVVSRSSLAEPNLAFALIALAGAFTAFAAMSARSQPRVLLQPVAIVVELAIAIALVAADPWVYDGERLQSLGSAWPLSGVMTAGLAAGPRGGVLAGCALAVGRALGVGFEPTLRGASSAGSSGMLYILAGWVAGYVAQKLMSAETEIASANARAEVADELHDGVLQTLAAVQRRSDDASIVRLARAQERRLRQFLSGSTDATSSDLVESLQATISSIEDTWEMRVDLVIIDSPQTTSAELNRVMSRSTGEALANAAKHGHATTATVCIDVDPHKGDLVASIQDNGTGFEPAAVSERGIDASMRKPLASLNGTVVISSSARGNTNVEFRVPKQHWESP